MMTEMERLIKHNNECFKALSKHPPNYMLSVCHVLVNLHRQIELLIEELGYEGTE